MSDPGVRVEIKVKGLKECGEKLKELGPKLGRSSLRKALNAVGDFWVPEVKSRAPNVDDALRDSIAKKVNTRARKDGNISGSVTVGPNIRAPRHDAKKSFSPGIYAMFVEFGLKTRDYPAHPFMRPAFDSTADKAVQVFSDTLKSELEVAVKE